eukprot:3119665-Pleurochrysis_carterae.AAC.3
MWREEAGKVCGTHPAALAGKCDCHTMSPRQLYPPRLYQWTWPSTLSRSASRKDTVCLKRALQHTCTSKRRFDMTLRSATKRSNWTSLALPSDRLMTANPPLFSPGKHELPMVRAIDPTLVQNEASTLLRECKIRRNS